MELLHYGTEYVFPLGLEPKTLKSGVITAPKTGTFTV